MGTTTKRDLNVIKWLALSLASPKVLLENKATVISLLQEEDGLLNPDDVVNKILVDEGSQDQAIDAVRCALWQLYYEKECVT